MLAVGEDGVASFCLFVLFSLFFNSPIITLFFLPLSGIQLNIDYGLVRKCVKLSPFS